MGERREPARIAAAVVVLLVAPGACGGASLTDPGAGLSHLVVGNRVP
jgi:hypothetical protein